jgi:hypothetical protein
MVNYFDGKKQAYEVAIYMELGEDVTKELNDLNCEIIIDIDTLTYTFKNVRNR